MYITVTHSVLASNTDIDAAVSGGQRVARIFAWVGIGVVASVCGFDFNILTAFIRLGRAGPRRGPGALHIILIYRLCALQPCPAHISPQYSPFTAAGRHRL